MTNTHTPPVSGANGRLADNLATAVAVLAVVTGLYLYRGYAGDDTFIHLTYARNLLAGMGFSFNPGEPSYGSTSPLWTLLIAAVGRIMGGDVYGAAKLLGVIATISSVFAFRSLARTTLGPGLLVGLATVTFAVDPWLWKWGGSGMETPLALLIALVAARFHLRRRKDGGAPASTFLLGLGTLLRPELFGLFLIALFDRLFLARRSPTEALFAVFGYLVPIVPWLVFALASFGDVVPTTVHAKSGTMPIGEVLARTMKILGASYLPSLLSIAVLVPLAVAKRRTLGGPANNRIVVWGWAFGLPLAYLVTESYVASRYLLLATPFLVLTAFFALGMLVRARVQLVSAVLVLLATAVSSGLVQHAVVYPRTRFTRGVDDRLIEVAEWLRASTPENALVAVHEVGAVGYFADRRVLDTAGLVTPEALPYVATYRIPELLAEYRPHYYVSSGDHRIDQQVFGTYADALTLLFERPVQRGGSSALFAEPLQVGVYRFSDEFVRGAAGP